MRTFLLVLSILAATLALGASSAAARAPLYAGTTAKGQGLVLRLTADGKRLRELRVTWTDSCDRRRVKFTLLDRTDRIRIRGGRFDATRRYVESGSRRRVTVRVTGRLGKVARGTFSARSTVRGRRCTTGSVRWSARRIR